MPRLSSSSSLDWSFYIFFKTKIAFQRIAALVCSITFLFSEAALYKSINRSYALAWNNSLAISRLVLFFVIFILKV